MKRRFIVIVLDGFGMGIGFTLALFLMAAIRETFGHGTFCGMEIPVLKNNNISIMTMAPGGFFVFGLLIAAVNKFSKHKPKKNSFGCEGCPQFAVCAKSELSSCNDAAEEDE